MKRIPDLSGGLELRPVDAAHEAELLEIYRQCEDFLALGPQPQASLEMVRADQRQSAQCGGIFCGIFSPQSLLFGVVDFIPAGFEGDESQAFLELIMLAPSWRNRGIGTAVVQAVEAEIARNGQVNQILVAVQVNNSAGRRFWERQGYRIFSGPRTNSDGTTVVLLQKKIKKHL